MAFISQQQKHHLKLHKYSATGTSICEPLMQKFWNRLVLWLPLWLAPNLITLCGLIVNIVTSGLLIYYCPTATEEAPRWAYYLAGIGLFIYQSLDAVDGKQARRTKSSSPLGELFDHGCDAISMIVLSYSACIALQTGGNTVVLILVLMSNAIFFSAQWQTYIVGSLCFGLVDVTEAQLIFTFVHIITGYYGPAIWQRPSPMGVSWAVALISVATVGLIAVVFRYMYNIFFIQRRINRAAGKAHVSVSGSSVSAPVLSPLILFICAMVIHFHDVTLFRDHTSVFIVCFGLCFAKISWLMVVAHMTKTRFPILDSVHLVAILLALNSHLEILTMTQALHTACALNVLNMLVYSTSVCLEICQFLNIQLFRIPYPPPADS
eukprot:TRINITY_DN4147_c0_g1::TRINITY_DN4147_c0_g1_i1::g.2013::m.2013 TRINITY_DN4147_c0_g1::TRINITY_DN4147_c0_g1_i1::g.2013  ORF type:complete len:378 (-),score=35.37,sp/Q7ZYQ3/CEPT1_XENLA/41.67/2e-87,CDP-OH_P_transf/PF01066.16/2.3e-22,CDP-OH_P_transf/PF01066.16/1.5e+04 TRINITY_DN4147_c0_g1_i1:371-1504(-)